MEAAGGLIQVPKQPGASISSATYPRIRFMEKSDYPALFVSADSASNTAQWRFMAIAKVEYALLVVAAILTMNLSTAPAYLIANAMVFGVLVVFLVFRSLKALDQNWYSGRAIAESVKTLTWRYMMKSAPFDGSDNQADKEFQLLLRGILSSNTRAANVLSLGQNGHNKEVTGFMRRIRNLPLEERAKFYAFNRVDEQHKWYLHKADDNIRAFRGFIGLLIGIYLVAGISTLVKIVYPNFTYYPTEPLIVLAGTMLGWIQIKKFNELGAAYTLTAREIGLIKIGDNCTSSEAKFSEYVNDAEMAFSREHTQWIARQAG